MSTSSVAGSPSHRRLLRSHSESIDASGTGRLVRQEAMVVNPILARHRSTSITTPHTGWARSTSFAWSSAPSLAPAKLELSRMRAELDSILYGQQQCLYGDMEAVLEAPRRPNTARAPRHPSPIRSPRRPMATGGSWSGTIQSVIEGNAAPPQYPRSDIGRACTRSKVSDSATARPDDRGLFVPLLSPDAGTSTKACECAGGSAAQVTGMSRSEFLRKRIHIIGGKNAQSVPNLLTINDDAEQGIFALKPSPSAGHGQSEAQSFRNPNPVNKTRNSALPSTMRASKGRLFRRHSVKEMFADARALEKLVQEDQIGDPLTEENRTLSVTREETLTAAAASAAAERIGEINLLRTRSRSTSPGSNSVKGGARSLIRKPSRIMRLPSNDDNALDDVDLLDHIAESDADYRRNKRAVQRALEDFHPSEDDW